SRIVEHLNLEALSRVVQQADRIDQAIGHVHFVVDRKLDGYSRQRVERRRLNGLGILVPHVKIHEVIPVPAIDGQNAEDKEITDEDDCLRGRHSVSKSERRTSGDYTAVSADPTSATPTMTVVTVAELQQLLDHVRDGTVAPGEVLDRIVSLLNARSYE